MKNNIGNLIKQNRLLQNFSQETLCKDICVVSYLSKIENGLVSPNEEIIQLLFKQLNIDYLNKEEIGNDIKLFEQYFDNLIFFTDNSKIIESINIKGELYRNSSLCVWYELFLVYEKTEEISVDFDGAKKQLNQLDKYHHNFDQMQKFFFYLAKASISEDFDEQIESLNNALVCFDCSYISIIFIEKYMFVGKVQQALLYCAKLLNQGIKEGNFYAIYTSSLWEVSCYSQLQNIELMLKAHNKNVNLCRNHHMDTLWVSYYNCGATLLELKMYDKALDYIICLKKDESVLSDYEKYSIYHKLSIIYYKLNDTIQGDNHLIIARQYAALLDNNEINLKFCDMIAMLSNKSYLNNNDYHSLVEEIYIYTKKNHSYGFLQFIETFYIESLISKRRYKEALFLSNSKNV